MNFGQRLKVITGLGGGGKTADIQARVKNRASGAGAGSIPAKALQDLEPSVGDKAMTRAEVLELIDALQLRGIPGGFRTDSDAITAATAAISTDGEFVPGGAAVHIVGFKGPETVQVNSLSHPKNISGASLGGRPLIDNQSMPFFPCGRGWVAVIPFGEKGGKTYTATCNVDYSTADAGTVETMYFDSEDEAWMWVSRFTG